MECVYCGGPVEARKTIMQNGALAIAVHCPACGRRGSKGAWVAKALFTQEQIDAMPRDADYTGRVTCQVAGCHRTAVEWHHYAPRYLFGDAADHWPVGPLCLQHHRAWHAALQGVLMRRCPHCDCLVDATALVTAFNDPPEWSFWGAPGGRWIVCQADSYVHFRVIIDGRQYHRLATIAPEAAPPARPQGQGRGLPLLEMVTRKAETTTEDEWL